MIPPPVITSRSSREWGVRGLVCSVLVALSILPGQARAGDASALGDLSLEQLVEIEVATVYSASRYEQKVTRAPSSVSIVTADEMKKFGHRTLEDVLRSVRGVYVSNDRNYSYLGMRGFLRPGDYNSRFLVQVDGHRVNDNIYDGALLGTDALINLDLIDRVEIIRGPSSSIYGDNAFFGVINIVTRRGAQIGGAEISGSYGSFDSYSGRFTYGNLKNELEFVLSGSLYGSAGERRLYYPEFDPAQTGGFGANNGIAENSDEDNAYRLFSSLVYRDFTLTGAFSTRTKNVPTASFGTVFNDGREETTDLRGIVSLKYEHAFEDDLRVMGRVAFDHYNYYATYPLDNDTNLPPVLLNKDETIGQSVTLEWQATKTFAERHTGIVGAEYREHLRQFQLNYDEEPRTEYLRSDHGGRSVGVYGQAEVAILTNLLLNAGVRYDYFSTFGSTVNPRAGLIYSPVPSSTVKLLYGRAFRAPNDYELNYVAPGSKTNPDLDPETIQTYEMVFEQYLPRNHRLSLSSFYYEIDNLISQTVDPADDLIVYRNIEQARAAGIEFEIEGRYARGLLARASYSFQRAEDADTGDELSNSPRHLARLNLAVPLYAEKIFAGLELQYHGKVRTLSGNRVDDFVLVNLNLFARELVKGLEVSAAVYNLFNTFHGYPGSGDHLQDVIRQPGRTFGGKITYRF